MKKRKNCFKLVYLVFVYAFSLAGCSNNFDAEQWSVTFHDERKRVF